MKKKQKCHAFHKPLSKGKVPFLQPISGFPKYPGRHLQMPLWNSDMQLAFGPHPTLLHASIQDPWWQVSLLLQSWSLTHCGLASTVKQTLSIHAINITHKNNLPFRQVPDCPATVPLGHMQATLLKSLNEPVTTHSCIKEQGFCVRHGFLQLPLMQVSFSGQSLSTLQSGSSDTTAEKTCSLRVRVLQGPYLLPLTLNTRYMAISNQRISAGANLSVISGTTFSTLSTVAWSAKRLTFFSGETTARNKVTFFSGSTIRIATTACLNACN